MRKLFLVILIFMMPLTTLAQESPLDLTCDATTVEGAEIGDSYDVSCPADCNAGSIWGTDIYTNDSNVCTAAAHAGVITLEDGGEFTINFVEGLDEYAASEQNDISSSEWGAWSLSFTFEGAAIEIEWTTRANELEGDPGTEFVVSCPEAGEASSLWGTEIYTDDSSMCTAAVHMGLIDFDNGGEFLVTILEGEDEYAGSEQNDIESSDWGSWSRSFSVSMDEGSEALEIEWNTRANELEGDPGTEFVVLCPEDGEASSLWGTEIYTDDSSMCTAAVHMGLIDFDNGGEFTVTILEGEDEYAGSEQNDIESSDWGSWSRSFSVSMDEASEALEIEWNTRGNELEGDPGTEIVVLCPEDGEASSLWGTEIYTDDSSVCTAAVHMDLIDFKGGGEFTVTILEGEDEYEGSEQNDIESSNWGSWSRSFSVSE